MRGRGPGTGGGRGRGEGPRSPPSGGVQSIPLLGALLLAFEARSSGSPRPCGPAAHPGSGGPSDGPAALSLSTLRGPASPGGRGPSGAGEADGGEQVTAGLKSRQHPRRESSAPALPAICSRLLRPAGVLRSQVLQSASEATSSSELWEKAVWSGRRVREPELSVWAAVGWETPASDAPRKRERTARSQPLGTVSRHPRLLGPRARGPGRVRHPRACKSGGQGGPARARPPAPLLPACSAPAEVRGQGGEGCEDRGTGCPDKTEGTLQREMQNNQENMPEVTSRAQGTKKESGRNRANSERPRRKPIP